MHIFIPLVKSKSFNKTHQYNVSLARHRSVRQDILSNVATSKDLLSHLPKTSTEPNRPSYKFGSCNYNLLENKLLSLTSSRKWLFASVFSNKFLNVQVNLIFAMAKYFSLLYVNKTHFFFLKCEADIFQFEDQNNNFFHKSLPLPRCH